MQPYATCVATRFETGLGHLGFVLSRSSRSDLVYKISGSDPDSALRSHALMMASGSDQSNKLSTSDCDA